MTWSHTPRSSKATHIELGKDFAVEFSKNPAISADDIQIRPVAPDHGLSAEQIDILRLELWKHMLEEEKRLLLRSLIESTFGGDRSAVASIISHATSRKVSARAIQAWLIAGHKPSSRKCPDWAVKVLEDYARNPDNAQSLRYLQDQRPLLATREWSMQVADKHCVEFATNEMESDSRRQARWRSAGLSSIPDMLCEHEKKTEDYLAYLHDHIQAVQKALGEATDFDEFKYQLSERWKDITFARWQVRQARHAIETKTEEFADDDGLL